MKYSASLMSNAKWLKLFRAVFDAKVAVTRAEWYFIDAETPIHFGFPAESDLQATGVADGRFPPFEYKWIERIHVPRSFRPDSKRPEHEVTQDVDEMLAALHRAGQFPVEENSDGISIFAYKR
jgi:hypothetical protein